jgi:hypothetical protein
MNRLLSAFAMLCLVILVTLPAVAQEASDQKVGQTTARDIVAETRDTVDRVAEQVNQDERARRASSSVLQPIYKLAEYMSFPAFHWVAFAMMVTGVVSFALQLVLAKLVVLAKSSFSLTEVLSDALGLVISLIGLVLTTQAATENSKFTESAFAVLSATSAGIVLGLIFYWWGQRREVEAVKGRRPAES